MTLENFYGILYALETEKNGEKMTHDEYLEMKKKIETGRSKDA